jgi:REP element-mobilizing transposase RayT
MGHSFPNVLIHSVFSTRDRVEVIPADLQPRLWKYLVGIGMNHEIPILAAGGMANHAHVLFALPSTVTISKVLQTLKANSSRWIGEHGIRFEWQQGYGAFSVSPPAVARVKRYIADQQRHHARQTFEQEFIAMLKKAGVAYDPQYVFG